MKSIFTGWAWVLWAARRVLICIILAFPFCSTQESLVCHRCTREACSLFAVATSTSAEVATVLEAKVRNRWHKCFPSLPKTSKARGTNSYPMALLTPPYIACFRLSALRLAAPFRAAFLSIICLLVDIGLITVTSADRFVCEAQDDVIKSNLRLLELGGAFGRDKIGISK